MEFKSKAVDQEGLDILDVVSKAKKLNNWMYQTIEPYCKGVTLEIGSGIGNISEFFVTNKYDISVSDLRENYRTILKDKFKLPDNKVLDLDIVDPDFDTKSKNLLNTFDSVFSLNVVEHIKDDNLAIKNMVKLLKPGGNLVILVPAYQALYNNFDTTLEHYRRYNKKSLTTLMGNYGEIISAFYFNAVGTLGWWVSGKLFKNKMIPEGEMKLYNTLVPIIKIVDKVTFNKVGLSVICVITKK
jgi:2-polyprenyl-3-methyl-5-hydroxy-6-metoxy-1,4-benzoquinol methylase